MTGKPKPGSRRSTVAEKHKAELAAATDKALKTGRPRALDDSPDMLAKSLQTITGCGSIWCTEKETAAVLGVSLATLLHFWTKYPDSKEAWLSARDTGKASLRRTQYKLAEKSADMAKWLGMQHLDQRDPHRVRELDLREQEAKLRRHEGDGLPINIRDLSLAQLMQLADRIKQALTGGDGAVALPAPTPDKLV